MAIEIRIGISGEALKYLIIYIHIFFQLEANIQKRDAEFWYQNGGGGVVEVSYSEC